MSNDMEKSSEKRAIELLNDCEDAADRVEMVSGLIDAMRDASSSLRKRIEYLEAKAAEDPDDDFNEDSEEIDTMQEAVDVLEEKI